MDAIVISVGDELVLGQTVDTNSAWLSRELAGIGWRVRAHITVADDQPAIERAIRESLGRCEAVIVTGGIGPTEDDLTRQALAAVMAVPLEEDPRWIEALRGFFEKRGREMPQRNRIQAMIPRGAGMIHNHAGTAAGIHARVAGSGVSLSRGAERHAGTEARTPEGEIGTPLRAFVPDASVPLQPEPRTVSRLDIFVLPGVPKEMQLMFRQYVQPRLRACGGAGCILSRTQHTFGMGESAVAELLGELMTRGRNPSVGTTVANGIVSLRINAHFDSREQAERELERTAGQCRGRLGDLIFGEDDETLEAVVGGMLKQGGATVATAESCTGGLLAKLLTDVAGSSAWFVQGWVTYTNESKSKDLGVAAALIDSRGAVSEEVAAEMARQARARSAADFVLAVTGIAGPSGGTEEKPVGAVCIALSHGGGVSARTFNFTGDRETIRDRSAKMALTMLRYHLLGRPLPL